MFRLILQVFWQRRSYKYWVRAIITARVKVTNSSTRSCARSLGFPYVIEEVSRYQQLTRQQAHMSS